MEKRVIISFLIGIFLLFNVLFISTDFFDDGNPVQNVIDCGVLNTSYAVYTLSQSIDSGADGDCLIIANESIILDCAGNNITFGNSSGGVGIINMDAGTMEGYTNVTIKNCNIYENLTNSMNATAIFFGANSSSATIFNNTITTQGEGTGGMLLNTNLTSSNISSNNLTVSGNNGIGMTIMNGSDTSINSNTFTVSGNNGVGIVIMNGSSISMDSNDLTISGNLSGGIYLIEGVTDSNVTSNNINLSVSNSENTTSIILSEGSNSNLLYNNTITTSGGGIMIGDSISTNISSNIIVSSASNFSTVSLENANSSIVENNDITTALIGIYVQGSPNTNVSSNNITSSSIEDTDTSMIRLEDSDGSIVDHNIIITFDEGVSGIAMEDVLNVLVTLNTITTSGEEASGIYLFVSDNTNITSNNITTNNTNSAGIFSTASNSTLIFNNTITTTGNSSNGIYIFNLFNTITNNTLNTTNGYAIYVDGLIVTNYNHTIENNTEQGENILYLFNNDSGIVKDQTLGQLIVTNSTNITIDNVTVNYDGLTFAFTNDSLINNSNFTTSANNIHGIDFFESSHNNVTSCGVKTLTGDESCVIYFYSNSSDYNIFYNNILNVTAENSLSGSGAGVCWATSAPANNIWNTTKTAGTNIIDGPNLGGNFWTNSLGTGYSDTCIDADGDYICDYYYNVIDNNIDYLPLKLSTNAIGGCGTLSIANYTHYLNQSIDVNGTCFNITANNITLNLNGFNITGNATGEGINVTDYNDTKILNGLIYNFSNGILLNNSQNSNITNITLRDNNRGLYIDSSPSNIFSDITINTSGQNGVYLIGTASSNNNFTEVIAENTISPHYDIEFDTEGINGTWIIDTFFNSYAFKGAGGIVNFKVSGSAIVEFLEPINGSGTNLTLGDLNVGSNLIFVNSSSNSGLSKSANITLYGITFIDPKPQYSNDGATFIDCTTTTDPACSELGFSGDAFKFNTTHFTYFRAAEAYVAPSPSGGRSSSYSFWRVTYVINDSQFRQGYTKELAERSRIQVNINNSNHYIGVVELTNITAKINVSSSPQQATFLIGGVRRFDVTENGYYDVLVTLNGIADNKANVTVLSIFEKVTKETIKEEQDKEKTATSEEEKPKIWIFIIVIIIILVLIGIGYKKVKKKRFKFNNIKKSRNYNFA